MINLVTHAAAGLGDGGRIRVETACIEQGERGDLPAGDYVALRVSDDGPPLPVDVRERLFEPFYDPQGRGSGMSMATCYGITVQARGQIRAALDEEGHNLVEVLLPRTRDELTNDPIRVPSRAGAHRVARILLAEDEAGLREQVEQLLRTVGHDVVAVADGQDALDMLADETEHFDLVLTDVLMPRRSGVDVARAVAGRVPVILMSGFVADAAASVDELSARHTVLTKPVRPDVLLRSVQEALPRKG